MLDASFRDRTLTCVDCSHEFIFTAGEQVFFHDKQFKNDPKRCKPCKSRRSGLSAAAAGLNGGVPAAGISRTETRTECSACGIETTVPFKPTQGRPVLCRQCFQAKLPASRPLAAAPAVPVHSEALAGMTPAETASALSSLSLDSAGEMLSPEAAVLAAASMAAASADSNVATMADLASLTQGQTTPSQVQSQVPTEDPDPEPGPGPEPDSEPGPEPDDFRAHTARAWALSLASRGVLPACERVCPGAPSRPGYAALSLAEGCEA